MEKMNLILASGGNVTKPVITAFKENGNEYLVLDNEINGSMGLPIILVCKIVSNRVVKIVDGNEWQNVKESLKKIIAGNGSEFIKVPNEMNADDVYYTQLTLPVPSFDALKNNYVVSESLVEDISVSPNESNMNSVNVNPTTPNVTNEPVSSSVEGPVNMSTIETEVNNVADAVLNSIPNATEPTFDDNNANVVNPSLNIEQPVVNNPSPTDINIVNPVMNTEQPKVSSTVDFTNITPPSVEQPTVQNNVLNEQATSTYVEPNLNGSTINDAVEEKNVEVEMNPTNETELFKEQKEAFMQACENMFDALVQKFEKELEKYKKTE